MDLETRLNGEREKVYAWLVANKLTINVEKTEYMLIGTRQKISQIIDNPQIVTGEERVKRVSSTKSLGIIIDENLN